MTIKEEEDLVEVEIEQPEPPEVEVEGAEAASQPEPPENEAILALKRSVENSEAQRERERQARIAAERRAETAEITVAEARKNEIESAISSTKAALDEHKRLFAEAMDNADYRKAADLQEKIAEATGAIRDLDNGRIELERQRAEPKVQQGDPAEDYISKQSHRTQDYLRKHKEIVTDQRLNYKAVAGHNLALAEGISPDTDSYFDFIDKHMGYAQPEKPAASKPAPSAPIQRAAAPVSRGSKDALPKLTQGEAQAADAMGITRVEYARRKREMSKPEWNGPRYDNGGYAQ